MSISLYWSSQLGRNPHLHDCPPKKIVFFPLCFGTCGIGHSCMAKHWHFFRKLSITCSWWQILNLKKKKLIELRWDDHFQLDELFAPMPRLFLYHELVKVMNCIKYGQSCINLENFSTITFQFKLYSNIPTCSIYSDACFSHTGLEIP